MREFKTSSTLSTTAATAATLSTTAAATTTATTTTTRSETILQCKILARVFFSERVFQNLNMCSFFEAATNFF